MDRHSPFNNDSWMRPLAVTANPVATVLATRAVGRTQSKPDPHHGFHPHAHTVLLVDNSPLLSQLFSDFASLSDPQCRSIVTDSMLTATNALEGDIEPCLIVIGGQFSVQQVAAFLDIKDGTTHATVPVVWIRSENSLPIMAESAQRLMVVTGPRDDIRLSSFCSK
jgi:hypothetical protein